MPACRRTLRLAAASPARPTAAAENKLAGGKLPFGKKHYLCKAVKTRRQGTRGAGGRHKKTSIAMKKLLRHSGIALVVIGGLTLVASQLAGWTDINGVQQAGLGLIIAGIFVHVAIVKRQSQY